MHFAHSFQDAKTYVTALYPELGRTCLKLLYVFFWDFKRYTYCKLTFCFTFRNLSWLKVETGTFDADICSSPVVRLRYWHDQGRTCIDKLLSKSVHFLFPIGVCVYLSAICLAVGALRASHALHRDLLSNSLQVPMYFFDTTPSGRILNRFSKDMEGVDTLLPRVTEWFIHCIGHVAGSLFVISFSTPLFLTMALPLGIFYFFVQVFRNFPLSLIVSLTMLLHACHCCVSLCLFYLSIMYCTSFIVSLHFLFFCTVLWGFMVCWNL